MAVKPYDPKTKAAFLKAATDARAAGKSLPEVHAAAKAAGYPGTVKGITRMLESAGPNAKPKEKAAAPAKKAAASKPAAKPSAKSPAALKPAAKSSPTAKPAAAKPKPSPAPKAAEKAPAAPGKRYSPAAKAAIMRAAILARGTGTWAEAHKAAKNAGYRGSVQGIVKMLRASNRKKHPRKVAVKQAAVKRSPGRPKGSVIKRGSGRPKGTGKRLGRPLKTVSVNGMGSIQAVVDRIVRERVSAALDRAIAVLQGI